MSKEAMKLTLARLQARTDTADLDAIAALKKALAEQPAQQEPWLLETTQTLAKNLASKFYPEVTQWECLDNLAGVISQIDNMTAGLMRKPAQQEPVALVISGALVKSELPENYTGHLYASPPAQQEPVTWGVDWGKAGDIPCVSIIKRLPGGGIEVVAVEYAPYEYNPPAKRTWVGLSDEESTVIWANSQSVDEAIRATEKQLMENNI